MPPEWSRSSESITFNSSTISNL